MAGAKTVRGGFFVTFEGAECTGKSTQAELLRQDLAAAGYAVVVTREPGGTVIGEELRRLVKHVTGPEACCPEAELLVFCASRAQLVQRVILPQLQAGGIVICDRFADSTTAYQGYGRGLPVAVIQQLHEITTAGRLPDLTVLIDVEVAEQLRRDRERRRAGEAEDRFDAESRAFHERVRAGYRAIAEQAPARVRVVRGDRPVPVIQAEIRELVTHALARLR